MRKVFIFIVCAATLLSACSPFEQKRSSGIVAEYNGKVITKAEIDVLTTGMTSEDSLRVAEHYIQQWAIDMIEYDIAKDKASKEIERLVDDYRRSLYIHEYEKRLIAQRMPQMVEDTEIQAFYDLHSKQLILPETIVRGLLLVVPNKAPNMNDLRKRMQQPEEENLEYIEKFAYQYASGYELFLENWKNMSEIIVLMPFEQDNLNKQLKTKRQIEVQDSVNTYILQVTDMHLKGEQKPLTYARQEIETILLRQRQVEFLEKERYLLYEKALKEGKLKLYEN
jgi:hypothetical protein